MGPAAAMDCLAGANAKLRLHEVVHGMGLAVVPVPSQLAEPEGPWWMAKALATGAHAGWHLDSGHAMQIASSHFVKWYGLSHLFIIHPMVCMILCVCKAASCYVPYLPAFSLM